MGSKSERLITEALGCPDETTTLDFTSTTVSGVLDASETYRMAATEDCYWKLEADNAAADSDDMLQFGGIPEIFTTTESDVVLNVIRKDTDGTLHVTKMKNRGK